MNNVTYGQLFDELGAHTGTALLFDDLMRLQESLVEASRRTDLGVVTKALHDLCQIDPEDCPVRNEIVKVARFAPSITIRSESELLGVSMPRFCIRLYLDHDERFVINLRRKDSLVAILKNQEDLKNGWANRRASLGRTIQGLKSDSSLYTETGFHPVSLVRHSSWIADCFLEIPHWVASGEFRQGGEFKVLSQNWGSLIGEPDGNQTIYVEGLHLSGVCAQMGSFMASAAICQSSKPLHSVAEITFLLGDRDGYLAADEFIVTEPSPSEIIHYFADPRVELHAQHQLPSPEFISDSITTTLGLLIRSYVMSGMPLLLLGDRRAFWELWTSPDNPWCQQNTQGFTSERDMPSRGEEPHACCVIGCSLDHGTKKTHQLLVHDPVAGPYLRCDIDALYNALQECFGERGSASVISVAPDDVLLSFATELVEKDDETDNVQLGVADLAGLLVRQIRKETGHWSRFGNPSDSEFRLVQFNRVMEMLKQQLPDKLGKSNLIAQVSDFLNETDRRESEQWCWLQFGTEQLFVLIWNAQKPGPIVTDQLLKTNALQFIVAEAHLLFGRDAS